MNKYSETYFEILENYKKFHKFGTKKLTPSKTFAGYSLAKWINIIKKIIEENNCKSLIDYGCGKAILYNNKITIDNIKYNNVKDFWKIKDCFLYDPAIDIYDNYPKDKSDIVICTDVIEHIPEEDVITFIDDIYNLAHNSVFIVIATMPASKYFENGKNIHICLKSKDEWKEIFQKFKLKYPKIKTYIYFND